MGFESLLNPTTKRFVFGMRRRVRSLGYLLEGRVGEISCASFSPDGELLVLGSEDQNLKLWTLDKFTEVGSPFEGHPHGTSCVAFSSDGLRIISGGNDNTVRLWSVETRELICDPLIGHTCDIHTVVESSDGRFLLSCDWSDETIIRDRCTGVTIWQSEHRAGQTYNTISAIEAERIIRSCGQETPHIWPSSFPEFSAEMYCKEHSLFSNVQGEQISLGNLPSTAVDWKFSNVENIFAAGLRNGTVAICRLVE